MAAPTQSEEQAASMAESATTEQSVPQPEGRRTQLKIVREGVESLRTDVWSFRRNHESSIKKLQADVKNLRKEVAAHTTSKQLSEHAKNTDAGNKKLEKQVAVLRAELVPHPQRLFVFSAAAPPSLRIPEGLSARPPL
jgi:hypothetical protein